MAPPSTPAPSRFLLSKRPGPSQGGRGTATGPGTDGSGPVTPTPVPVPPSASARQFVATPRFAAAASLANQHQQRASTPTASSGRPAFVSSYARTARPQVDDDIDVIESSQAVPDDDDDDDFKAPRRRVADGIVEDYSSSQPSEEELEEQQSSEEDHAVPRPYKRRRITVSPEPLLHVSSSSPVEEAEDFGHGEIEVSESFAELIPQSGPSSPVEYHGHEDYAERAEHTDLERDHRDAIPSSSGEDDNDMESGLEDHRRDATPARQRHPTFRPAPRFVTAELPAEQQQFALPEAFSPQRRGARYVAGGLAAEVRDWLFQFKGDGGSVGETYGAGPQQSPAAAKVVVDEVTTAPGMKLLRVSRFRGDSSGEGPELQAEPQLNIILAGEGRISGLAGRNRVDQGTVVAVHPPTWEVAIQGRGNWTMVCDWSVVDDNG